MFTSQLKLQRIAGRGLVHRLLHNYHKFPAVQSRSFFQQFKSLNAHKDMFEKDKIERKVVKDETEFERALREAKEDSLAPQITKKVEKKSLWERIKHEADHYWSGTKLLAAETSISSRLLLKTLKGKELSRREYRQLKRTTGDLLRVVPLLIMLVVPFLEFALPVLLKLFPNMLPSTFESKFQEEERKKNLLKVRIQMAKFLQETVGETRNSGEAAKPEDILRVARKFQDELTLNNLSRPQLVSLARFMSINHFGTDSYLRSSIESKLKSLAADDRMIVQDGVSSLSISELVTACMARGLSFNGVSPNRMRLELQQWLDLHLEHKVPSSLLLLSNAFQTTSRPFHTGTLEDKAEALQQTLSSLPHQVINEASLKVSQEEGVATNKQKLDVLKEQEEMIEDEEEQELLISNIKKLKEEEARKKEEESRKKIKEGAPEELVQELEKDEPSHTPELATIESELVDVDVKAIEDLDSELSEEEQKKLSDALKTMSSDSAISDVKETFHSLKEERQDFIEDVEEFKQFTQKDTPSQSDRLGTQVDKMIKSIEDELQKYDSEIGNTLNLVKPNEVGQISIQELEETLRVIRDHPNDERIAKIVKKLDQDEDGFVAMNELIQQVDRVDTSKKEEKLVSKEKSQ